MKTRISVLIIDDDPDICVLLESFFNSYNLSSVSVNTLEAAKVRLNKIIPMFIILDNSLPDGKGINFINYFKSSIPDVKIIVCSADDLEEELKRQAVNVYSVIKKPFLFKELQTNIAYPALLSVFVDDYKSFPRIS